MDEFGRTFRFEEDYARTLHCIPLAVRYKLDVCGVKLKLKHWLKFSADVREELLVNPCRTPPETQTYRQRLLECVTATREPVDLLEPVQNPAWDRLDAVPSELVHKAQTEGIDITLERWSSLSTMQRFALVKLSRPDHENKNFLPAVREFGLIHA